MSTPIRLHIFGLAHTITREEYSHCAFTGKVMRFAPMMQLVKSENGQNRFEVYHYGVATATSGADKQIDLMTVAEWEDLRVQSYSKLYSISISEARKILDTPGSFVGNLGNVSTQLYKEFNARLKVELARHYRSSSTDIVCLPFGYANNDALTNLNVVTVESGIGYVDSFSNYRIFESYAIMHQAMEKSQKGVQNYWFVVPNYYDIKDWTLGTGPAMGDRPRFGFLGRISSMKGIAVIIEIAGRFPEADFVLCGQGDLEPFIADKQLPNVIYMSPIHGRARDTYLGGLTAVLAPSMYMEPFCGVNVEAQLCGTPVITHESGALVETVEPFKTGILCHTLADFCYAIRMAVRGEFDRTYIRDRAMRMYGLEAVAKKYDYAFRTILDVHNGKNGWYSPVTYLESMHEYYTPSTLSKKLVNLPATDMSHEIDIYCNYDLNTKTELCSIMPAATRELAITTQLYMMPCF